MKTIKQCKYWLWNHFYCLAHKRSGLKQFSTTAGAEQTGSRTDQAVLVTAVQNYNYTYSEKKNWFIHSCVETRKNKINFFHTLHKIHVFVRNASIWQLYILSSCHLNHLGCKKSQICIWLSHRVVSSHFNTSTKQSMTFFPPSPFVNVKLNFINSWGGQTAWY